MPKIKDIPKIDRPREKFLKKGADALSKSDLLAILLGSGIKGKNIRELSDRIFKKFGKEHAKAVFLVKYNEQKFIQDIHKSTTPNDWIIRKPKNKATYGRIAKMIAKYSNYFEKEAKKYGFKIFNMDNEFENQLNAI